MREHKVSSLIRYGTTFNSSIHLISLYRDLNYNAIQSGVCSTSVTSTETSYTLWMPWSADSYHYSVSHRYAIGKPLTCTMMIVAGEMIWLAESQDSKVIVEGFNEMSVSLAIGND